MAERYKQPSRSELGIEAIINSYAKQNGGLGYQFWRFFRQRGVNTANLARIFDKSWSTIRAWERQDDAENGPITEQGSATNEH